jgi:hypothetical protein
MTQTALWMLRPRNPKSGPWEPWYDRCFGMVIEAATEDRARQLANGSCGLEGKIWADKLAASCDELRPGGKEGVVLQDIQKS